MPVVINEFEVVADSQPAQRRNGNEAPAEQQPQKVIEPNAIVPGLRALHSRALRAWAH